jgi:ppGpp synthetase/RelA/SpoT-type nucleotidyltranferase
MVSSNTVGNEISKNKLDKAGKALASESFDAQKNDLSEAREIVDWYRAQHLEPLTEVTLKLQEWLASSGLTYYVAQRLKRRPQIIRKLRRFPVRLTQLQDIGGCRVIFESNDDLNVFLEQTKNRVKRGRYFAIRRITDYRELGREDSGYRAVHLIVVRNDRVLEIQLRSRIQHHWAESIERASVIYGYHLKELEGDSQVLDYFKLCSLVFNEIESGRKPTPEKIDSLEDARITSEAIIRDSDRHNVFDGSINESFFKGMVARESTLRGKFHNWTMVFNWTSGEFLYWEITERKSDAAMRKYAEYEANWPAEQGYEVVMIGSSDVSTIRQTHSHYFGIESYDSILQDYDATVLGFAKRRSLDSDARRILQKLYSQNIWGKKRVSRDTLKNHYCHGLDSIELPISELERLGLIVVTNKGSAYSLNVKKKTEIQSFL